MNMTFKEVTDQLLRDLSVNENNKSVGSKKGGSISQFLAVIGLDVVQAKEGESSLVGNTLTLNLSSLKPLNLSTLRDTLSKMLTQEACAKLVKDEMMALVNGKVNASDVKSATTDMEKDMVNAWGLCQQLKENLDNDKTVEILAALNKCHIASIQFALTRVIGLELIVKHNLDDKASDLSIFKTPMLTDEEITLA